MGVADSLDDDQSIGVVISVVIDVSNVFKETVKHCLLWMTFSSLFKHHFAYRLMVPFVLCFPSICRSFSLHFSRRSLSLNFSSCWILASLIQIFAVFPKTELCRWRQSFLLLRWIFGGIENYIQGSEGPGVMHIFRLSSDAKKKAFTVEICQKIQHVGEILRL